MVKGFNRQHIKYEFNGCVTLYFTSRSVVTLFLLVIFLAQFLFLHFNIHLVMDEANFLRQYSRPIPHRYRYMGQVTLMESISSIYFHHNC